MGGGGNKSQHCVQTHVASDMGRATDSRANTVSQGTRSLLANETADGKASEPSLVSLASQQFRHTLDQTWGKVDQKTTFMNPQFLEQRKKLLLSRR